MELSDEQWKRRLTPEQYRILREKGTERAFTGKYWDTKEKGIYHCAGCGAPLFSSEDKYDSGTGWPSFTKPEKEEACAYEANEVLCQNCHGHLGHVFDDGPTGRRFCINSEALDLK